MRTSLAIAAGLVAVAHAGEARTVTEWAEVTVTKCTKTPYATDCPYTSQDWNEWDPSKYKTTTSSAWSAWEDPSKYKKTTSSVWSAWEDPSKYKTTTSSVWQDWDPKKPRPTTKPADVQWQDWENEQNKYRTTSKPAYVTWSYNDDKYKVITKTETVTVYVKGEYQVQTVYYACGYDDKGAPYTKQVDVYGKPVDGKDQYKPDNNNGYKPDNNGKPADNYNTWSTAKVPDNNYNTWSTAKVPDSKQTYNTWATGADGKTPADAYKTPAATGSWSNYGASPTAWSPVAAYTGAASRNAAGLIAGAGLAALLL